jgi:hypothetical protein
VADLVVVLTLLGDLQAWDAVVCTDGEVIGQVLASLVADGLVVDQSLAWPRARPGCWTAPRDSSPLAGICHRCSWPMRISRHRCRGVRRPLDGATLASSAAVTAQPWC